MSDEQTVIDKPGVYEYTIAETKVGTGDPAELWSSDTKTYDLKVYVKNGVNGGLEYSYAIFDEDTKLDEAAFENIYRPISGGDNASITITKKVTHGEWAASDTYTFNVTFGKTDITDPGDFTVTGGVGDAKDAIDITADSAYEFTLKDGQTFSFYGLPQGITYSIVETDPSTGEANYKETDISGATTADGLTGSGTLAADTTTVQYENIYEDIPMTGLAISIAPFIAMFAAVGAAIALYVAAKRRVR